MAGAGGASSGERLERDQGEGVLDPVQGLHATGDEAADVRLVVQIELHQQVVLAGDRVYLGDLLDVLHGGIGDLVGPAALAFDHDEDRLHQSSFSLGSSSALGIGRRMNSGTWSPMPITGPSDREGRGGALRSAEARAARFSAGAGSAGFAATSVRSVGLDEAALRAAGFRSAGSLRARAPLFAARRGVSGSSSGGVEPGTSSRGISLPVSLVMAST